MKSKLAWLRRRLEVERRHSATLWRMYQSVNDGLLKMLRQKDELESELQRARLEVETLHAKLIEKGTKS